MENPTPLSEEFIRKYDQDGAVFLPGVFTPRWIETLRAGVARNLEAPGEVYKKVLREGAPESFVRDRFNWQNIPEYRSFVFESPAGACAGQLMRSSQCTFGWENLFVKKPGSEEPTPWHQDQPYIAVDGWQNITLWVPLDPIPAANALRLVRGSHRWQRWFIPTDFGSYEPRGFISSGPEATRFEPLPDVDAMKDLEILNWDVHPGDAIAFHGLMLHSATGNPSRTCWRRALATRWFGDDARYTSRRPFPKAIIPTTDGLRDGDPLSASAHFPAVWRRAP
jgi:ectoine hydroxylase-related dioxygenase (phytanoyl-CoA dioxygenase family)